MSGSLPPPPPSFPPPRPPPPGYATSPPTEWVRATRRVGGLGTAIVVLVAVAGVGSLVSLATAPSSRDAAEDFFRTGDEDAFNDDVSLSVVADSVFGAAGIALVVVTIVWLFRMAANHRALGRINTWGPGWAIAGWILPPLLFIIPFLMLRETWKASAPHVPPGSPDWRHEGENPLLWVWFAVYSLVPIVLLGLGLSQVWGYINRDTDDLAEYFDEHFGLIIAGDVANVVAAVVWAVVVRSLTRRHARLTGETGADAGR